MDLVLNPLYCVQITSRVPNDLPEFCKAVIAQLKKSN